MSRGDWMGKPMGGSMWGEVGGLFKDGTGAADYRESIGFGQGFNNDTKTYDDFSKVTGYEGSKTADPMGSFYKGVSEANNTPLSQDPMATTPNISASDLYGTLNYVEPTNLFQGIGNAAGSLFETGFGTSYGDVYGNGGGFLGGVAMGGASASAPQSRYNSSGYEIKSDLMGRDYIEDMGGQQRFVDAMGNIDPSQNPGMQAATSGFGDTGGFYSPGLGGFYSSGASNDVSSFYSTAGSGMGSATDPYASVYGAGWGGSPSLGNVDSGNGYSMASFYGTPDPSGGSGNIWGSAPTGWGMTQTADNNSSGIGAPSGWGTWSNNDDTNSSWGKAPDGWGTVQTADAGSIWGAAPSGWGTAPDNSQQQQQQASTIYDDSKFWNPNNV